MHLSPQFIFNAAYWPSAFHTNCRPPAPAAPGSWPQLAKHTHGGMYGVCTLVTLLSAASAPLDLFAAFGAGSVEKLPLPALATWRLPQAECPRVRAAAVARAPVSLRSRPSCARPFSNRGSALPCARGPALPALASPRPARLECSVELCPFEVVLATHPADSNVL